MGLQIASFDQGDLCVFRFRVSYAPAAVLRQIISALAFSGLAARVQDSAEAPFGDGVDDASNSDDDGGGGDWG